jgi:hypothetical protein
MEPSSSRPLPEPPASCFQVIELLGFEEDPCREHDDLG